MSLGTACAVASERYVWQEYGAYVGRAASPVVIGAEEFGERVDTYSGRLSFNHTDVDIPGNNALPVRFERTYVLRDNPVPNFYAHFALGDWEVALPSISAMHAPDWQGSIEGQPGRRCSTPSEIAARPRPLRIGAEVVFADEFWQGMHLAIPEGGGELLYNDGSGSSPNDGKTYYWVAEGDIRVSCLPALANRAGGEEGFLVLTPDGKRYYFDWMAQNPEAALVVETSMIAAGVPRTTEHRVARRDNRIYPTRIEDRFGNWVRYTYSNAWNEPVRLSRVESNDGRLIVISYSGEGVVSRVEANGRRWTYRYETGGGVRRLVSVELPDQERWQIDFSGFGRAAIQYRRLEPDNPNARNCTRHGELMGPSTFGGRLTHPSGASANFKAGIVIHGRSNVPVYCKNVTRPTNNRSDDVAVIPVSHYDLSLIEKVVTGPALPSMTWRYNYASSISGTYLSGDPRFPTCPPHITECSAALCLSDDCAGTKRTAITAPDGTQLVYIYGNSHRYNEGKLVGTEWRDASGSVLRREEVSHDLTLSDSVYPARFGLSPRFRSAGFVSEFHRPERMRQITQQGRTFTRETTRFDAFARPLNVVRSSNVTGNPARAEVVNYHDDLRRWIIGQPSRLTVNGVVASETSYDSNAMPTVLREFGRTVQTLAYNADGTIRSVRDGNNRTTGLSNWKRGIARTIQYPATPEAPSGATRTAIVNDHGWITRITDENAFQTNYQYDPMGRLSRIAYPAGDSVLWNATALSLVRATSSAYGLPAGHWQHTVATGNGRKVTYLDALWRPVLVREYDTSDAGNTQRFTRQSFDHAGRPTFTSYPSSSGTATTGIWTGYDVLGRVRSMSEDSELGLLTTITEYLGGFQTRVTSPDSAQTTYRYLAWDEPSTAYIERIVHPEGAYTYFGRDAFGKPTYIRRRDVNNLTGVTRRYVYDAHQRLCKTVEPETGATIMAYDNADNIIWSRGGSDYTGSGDCNTGDIPTAQRIVRTYDARNRIQSLAFPDNLGNTAYSYTPDGLLASIRADNGGADIVSTVYTYNRRRLLTGEAVGVGDHQWGIGYGYDASGHLAALTLPGGETVSYAPNALGQPTRAGSHVTGVTYFPTGAIRQFTYGNGIVHTLTQNARGLPERSRDAYGSVAVHDDSFDYDGHGNVAAISDGLPGGRGNRTMTYDGLDRLTQAVSPMFGTATYTYDVLDNLTRARIGGLRARDHSYTYDTSNRLTLVTSTSGGTVASLSYDAQGNLSTRNGQDYRFDHGNRLRTAAGLEEYVYDGHGRRVKAAREGGASIYSVYGQDGVLRYQRDERSGKTTDYVHLGGSLVSMLEDPIALSTPTLNVPGYSATGSYTVAWSDAPTASRYELQERLDDGSWATVYNAAGTSRAFNGQAMGTWSYRVRACSVSACGAWSQIAQTTVQLPPAVAPILSVPTTGLNGSFSVSWNAVAAASEYQLQERHGGGNWNSVSDLTGTSLTVSGKAGGSWSYQVRACNAAGCGPWSEIKTVAVVHPPGSVSTLTMPATNTSGSYTVNWTDVSGASRYELVERLNSGSWSTIHNAASTSKAVSGKTTGNWSYQVRACNAAGCGGLSQARSIVVTRPPTSAPTLTAPATNMTGAYTVSWSAVTHATRYELQEQLNSAGWSGIHNAASRSKAVSGRSTGSWRYRVRACNAAGCGGWSAGITSVTVTVAPGAPILTAPASSANGQYYLSWNTVAHATSYRLDERTGNGAWTQIQSGSATDRTITVRTNGTRRYRARACNAAGCSGYSAERSVVVDIKVPPTPTGVVVTRILQNEACRISWNVSPGAQSYRVLRGAFSIGETTLTMYDEHLRCATTGYGVASCNSFGCSVPSSAVRP